MAATTLDALDYLAAPEKHPAGGICVAYGDEPFLKREVLAALRRDVLGADEGEFSLHVEPGRTAEIRDIRDELSTPALFGGGRRMVLLEEADDFVTRNRGELEEYVARPPRAGVLVLEVKTWASNTRLYKAVAKAGLQVQCKRPKPPRLLKWLKSRARQAHSAKLEPEAADLLLELMEPELGLLDQELARLALLGDPPGAITAELVGQSVGSWRTRTAWELIDAAAAGDAATALAQLDRLLLAGESAVGVLAQVAFTLRRFAAATRLVEAAERHRQRPVLRQALQEAGCKPFILQKAEQQLRQIGRGRGRELYRWLLEADLALKGPSSAPARARLVLETLIVKLSRAAA